MKVQILAVLACVALTGSPLLAQAAQPLPSQQKQTLGAPTGTSGAGASDLEGDLFPELRENADNLKAAYLELDNGFQKEFDDLMRTKRCQNNRVDGSLDRTIAAMTLWLNSEKRYWRDWNDKETKRVLDGQKTQAGMEEDLKRTTDLIEDYKKTMEQLSRDKAALEKSKRTEEIKAQIDGLANDIVDSQTRLTDAQRSFTELSITYTSMKSLLSVRLVNIRQNIQRLDAFDLDKKAYYVAKRTEAQEVCNMKRPDARTPLPKRVVK